jgi:Protein O-mannosyl-transferase TMEM260-like
MKNRAADLLLVFAIALAFYGVTLAPTVIWSDSAAFARQVLIGPLQFGTASDHPLFIAIGRLLKLLPFELAWLLNLESALFGAAAVAMVYRCARQLGTSPIAGAIGAAALGVSQAFWLHSVIAEVYSANAFFLAATLSFLLEWGVKQQWRYLGAALVVFAIGLTNHLVLLAVMPAALVFVAASNPRAVFGRRALLTVAGLAVALAAIAVSVPRIGNAIRHVWVGPPSIFEYFSLRIDPGPTLREAGFYVVFFLYQFPSIALPLGLLGIWTLLRTRRTMLTLLLLTMAINAGIFIRHTGFQSQGTTKFVFYISDYVVFAIFSAAGADAALRRVADRTVWTRQRLGAAMLAVVGILPPVLYAIVPYVASRSGIDLVGGSRLPYRDNQRFFLNPNKRGEFGAGRYGTEAFEVMVPNAVIFADATPYEVLRYLQYVEHVRPDVTVRSAGGYAQKVMVQWMTGDHGRRAAYLARWNPDDYDMTAVAGTYELVPASPVLEMRPLGRP